MLSIYCLAYFENWRTKVCSNYFYKIINIFLTMLLMYCACNVGPGICRVSSRAGEPKPQGTTWDKKNRSLSRLENCQEPKPEPKPLKKKLSGSPAMDFHQPTFVLFSQIYILYVFMCVFILKILALDSSQEMHLTTDTTIRRGNKYIYYNTSFRRGQIIVSHFQETTYATKN